MPLIYQHRIYRQDLHRNKEVLYVFGDNLQGYGLGGQAAEMRGERNAIGIPTKRAPTATGFLSDMDYETVVKASLEPYNRLAKHLGLQGIVVWPADDIGSGRAELLLRAPRIAKFHYEMKLKLEKL